MPAPRIALVVSIAAGVLAAAPAGALAGEVTGTGGEYVYTDTATNETNRLVVTQNPANANDLIFTDSAGAVDNSADCQQTSTTVVTCSTSSSKSVEAKLAGGEDELDGSATTDVEFAANGGAGVDELTGGADDDLLIGDGENDVLTGNAGFDTLLGGEGDDDLSGGADHDELFGEPGADDLQGGDGDDDLDGGQGADTISGGADGEDSIFFSNECGDTLSYLGTTTDITVSLDGVANDDTGDGDVLAGDIESVEAGTGNDRVSGNERANCLLGREGNDVLEGLGGNDVLEGRRGADTLDGGDGSDELRGESTTDHDGGADVYIGGDGVDIAFLPVNACDAGLAGCSPRAIAVTLDGVADDGPAGKGDDVRADVEDIATEAAFIGGPENVGTVNVTGSDAFNVINTSLAGDVVDPGGGSDLVFTDDGDDTINARDGNADRIECGFGNDTAVVDQLDIVMNCENVDQATVTFELEDRPPTLTFAPPPRVDPTAPTLLRADAADDRGIQQVRFVDDERVVCTDEAPPYDCAFQPRGEDVRANTLTAVAVDTSGQAAFAFRPVTVSKFRAQVTAALGRRGLTGRVRRPKAVTPALGCTGPVRVTIRSARRTITRRAKLTKTCTYRMRIRVRRGQRVTIRARFGGNAVLRAASARVRVG